MRIIFSGGGTVGHISPAIAIAEQIAKRFPDTEIIFIGREGGGENDVVRSAGIELRTLRISGFERRITYRNALALKYALTARTEAKKIIKDFGADMVIGTGGYVCWPVLSAAHSLKIFTALHESNAALGLCTRLLSDKVDILLLGQNVEGEIGKGVFAGNPIREAFYSVSRKEARAKLGIADKETFILSVGGSIGAEKLNDACIGLMRSFSLCTPNIKHVHSCGKRYYDNIVSELPFPLTNGKCKILPFISDMATHLHAADLVVSRCGAMTLSEIAYCSVPSILIPSPNVTNDHQTKNALHYCKKGASVMIEENELSAARLLSAVSSLLESKAKRMRMKIAAKELSVDNAAAKCVDKIMEKYENR